MDTPGRTAVTFGHVAMITCDLDRFRRFYEDVFSLRTVIVDQPDEMPFRRLASLSDAACAAVRFLVFEVPGYTSGLPDDVIGRRGRLDHFSFHTPDPDEFAELVRRLVELGASSGEVSDLGPARSVLFVDPDGAHHNLQTPNPAWSPTRTTEIIDPIIWQRLNAGADRTDINPAADARRTP